MDRFSFTISEMQMPTSLDPLDADYSNNLHASQMVHKALLEVADDNTLQSSLLSAFGYDSIAREITLELDPNSKFSDGSSVSIGDIEISIKRMMLKRPTFPVLKYIDGIAAWARQERALTKSVPGISTHGNVIKIRLTRNVRNPLFRFALPLYGVVKSDCVDINTNKLKFNCPVSGFYSIQHSNPEANAIVFARNENVGGAKHILPNRIELKYRAGNPRIAELKDLKGTNVILTEENEFAPEDKNIIRETGFERREQPNARFSVFQLNSKSEIFSDLKCRQLFAFTFRSLLAKTLGHPVESSIFSRVLPGYESTEELDSKISLSESTIEDCKERFRGRTIRWMPQAASTNNSSIASVLDQAARKLGLKLEMVPEVSRQQRFDDFVDGKLDILMGGSGFWAFDPVSDVQMLFTPGLHKPLLDIANDRHLQMLLDGLEFEPDPAPRMHKINEYLHEQALFNVYSHSKRVYLVRGEGINASIPIAITPPAPWQVFHVLQK